MTGVGDGFQFNHGSTDDVTPFTRPGRAGREKQMQRLAQQQPHRDDDDDWFNSQRRDHGRLRQQPPPPSRNVRVNHRSSEPVLDRQKQNYHAPPAPLLPLPPPPPKYFDRAPAGPRPGPSRGYPSSHEISAGYRHAPFASPPPSAPKHGPELSIRGAAQRRQGQDRNQRGVGGGYRSGEGREWDRWKGSSSRDGDPEWSPEWRQRNGYRNNHRRY